MGDLGVPQPIGFNQEAIRLPPSVQWRGRRDTFAAHSSEQTTAGKVKRSFLLGGFCIWRYQQRKLECKVFANNAAIHQSDVF